MGWIAMLLRLPATRLTALQVRDVVNRCNCTVYMWIYRCRLYVSVMADSEHKLIKKHDDVALGM